MAVEDQAVAAAGPLERPDRVGATLVAEGTKLGIDADRLHLLDHAAHEDTLALGLRIGFVAHHHRHNVEASLLIHACKQRLSVHVSLLEAGRMAP